MSKKKTKPLAESLDVAGKQRVRSKAEQEKMTAEDCCQLLRDMVEAEPTRVLTRNYFRCNGGIRESTWQQFWGAFDEYKAAADVTLTRAQRNLLLKVAKHASVDTLRAQNKLRASYSDKYLKPVGGRWRTILLNFDVHDIECDKFALRVYLDVARRLGPIITDVVNGGDLYDAPEFGKYHVDPRHWDPVKRFTWVDEEYWKPLREYCPDAEFTLIEGNHCIRVNALLTAQTPAVKVVLADFHGMTIPQFFGLDKWDVNYIAKADLACVDFNEAARKKELARNFKVFYNCFLVHHYKNGMKKGMPGAHGHHHRHIVWPHESPIFGAYSWHQFGCMHNRWASYMDGETFDNGFALIHIDTKTKSVQTEYIEVGATQCVAAGVHYMRGRNEI